MNAHTHPHTDDAIRAWTGLAYSIARGFHLPGQDRDDVRQEALIALWVGLRSHDPARVPLKPWLSFVVRRRLIGALQAATRPKHRVLSEAEPLDDPARSEQPRSSDLAALLAPLTLLEARACVGVAVGMEYAELGPVKAVDNALQRARRKLAA